MKKIVAILASVLLSLPFLCFATFASQIYTENYLQYTVEDDSITIVGYYGKQSEVTIPRQIAGFPVNTIATGSFSKMSTVTKINLPDTIMKIDENAFSATQTVVFNSNTNKSNVIAPDTTAPGQSDTAVNSSGVTDSNDSSVSGNSPSLGDIGGSSSLQSGQASGNSEYEIESNDGSDVYWDENDTPAAEGSSAVGGESDNDISDEGQSAASSTPESDITHENGGKTVVIIAVCVISALFVCGAAALYLHLRKKNGVNHK